MPSTPLMPTPISASWIMPTSFAPSPIAKVVFPVPSFASLVIWQKNNQDNCNVWETNKIVLKVYGIFHTSAFCLGETRQQITDAQTTASARNWYLASSFKAYVSVFPSMIKANAACGSFSILIICEAFVICIKILSFAAWTLKTFFLSTSHEILEWNSNVLF